MVETDSEYDLCEGGELGKHVDGVVVVNHAATHPLGQVIHVPLHLPVPVIIHIQLFSLAIYQNKVTFIFPSFFSLKNLCSGT